VLFAQVQQPSARYYPTEHERHQIYARLAELSGEARKLAGDPLYPDVAIYLKAGEFIISHPEEFVKPSYVKDTLDVLDRGLARAKELAVRSPSWAKNKGRVLRAYRSTVDGSLQPYGLIIPDLYSGQPIRLDVWLHGTNRGLNEVHSARCVRPQQRLVSLGGRNGCL
jgi:hypothetical protein